MSRRFAYGAGIAAVLVLIIFTIYWSPAAAQVVYEIIVFLSPLWLPALLFFLAWPLWLIFARSYYAYGIPYATLELKPGPETPRTAKPMELIFYSLYHRTDVSRKAFLLGQVRMPWSFEAYVHNGATRFFVHAPERHVAAISSRIRAEYRDIEIETVPDYAREVPFSPFQMHASMREYTLAKPDPYPLVTYEQYEKDTAHHDPFITLLEKLSSAGQQEHVLISLIVRPHQRDRTRYFEEPRDTLHEDAHRVIAGILGSGGNIQKLPAAQQDVVRAIEEALKKPSFDCGLRALYVADGAAYRKEMDDTLGNLFNGFNDASLNGFRAYDPRENIHSLAHEFLAISPFFASEYLVRLFRRRAFFAPPYIGKPFILNTEELATVFHLPQTGHGGVASHVTGVKLEPPENLPT